MLSVDARYGELPYPPPSEEFPVIHGLSVTGKELTLRSLGRIAERLALEPPDLLRPSRK